MLTDTISRSQLNTTQENEQFDEEILQTINFNKNQVLISKIQREKKNLFKNLMYNNFPVPTRKVLTPPSYKFSSECGDSTSCSTHNCDGDSEDESNLIVIDISKTEENSLVLVKTDQLQANADQNSEVKRLVATGPKSSQLLFCMTLFQSHMKGKWCSKVEQAFLKYSQAMLDYFSNNSEEMKNQHAESIAASICLLVESLIGISKKDFLEAMKPMKKNMLTKVEKIKKSTCYSIMKKAFKKVNSF